MQSVQALKQTAEAIVGPYDSLIQAMMDCGILRLGGGFKATAGDLDPSRHQKTVTIHSHDFSMEVMESDRDPGLEFSARVFRPASDTARETNLLRFMSPIMSRDGLPLQSGSTWQLDSSFAASAAFPSALVELCRRHKLVGLIGGTHPAIEDIPQAERHTWHSPRINGFLAELVEEMGRHPLIRSV